MPSRRGHRPAAELGQQLLHSGDVARLGVADLLGQRQGVAALPVGEPGLGHRDGTPVVLEHHPEERPVELGARRVGQGRHVRLGHPPAHLPVVPAAGAGGRPPCLQPARQRLDPGGLGPFDPLGQVLHPRTPARSAASCAISTACSWAACPARRWRPRPEPCGGIGALGRRGRGGAVGHAGHVLVAGVPGAAGEGQAAGGQGAGQGVRSEAVRFIELVVSTSAGQEARDDHRPAAPCAARGRRPRGWPRRTTGPSRPAAGRRRRSAGRRAGAGSAAAGRRARR